jgi:hypothetical protein
MAGAESRATGAASGVPPHPLVIPTKEGSRGTAVGDARFLDRLGMTRERVGKSETRAFGSGRFLVTSE